MNLFQTSPVVMSIIDYKIQKDITQTKEGGATERNDDTNTTKVITEAMRDVGAPVTGFILGALSSRKDNKNKKDDGSSKGSGTSTKEKDSKEAMYEKRSKELDELLDKAQNSSKTFPVIQKSLREKVNDSIENLYQFGNPFEVSNGIKLGIGSSIIPHLLPSLFM